MEAPDVLDLSVPGVVAYPGQLALPVMLLSCSRCAQQYRLLRESAPGRHSFQPAAVPLSDAREIEEKSQGADMEIGSRPCC
jgi:hypothetical protein